MITFGQLPNDIQQLVSNYFSARDKENYFNIQTRDYPTLVTFLQSHYAEGTMPQSITFSRWGYLPNETLFIKWED